MTTREREVERLRLEAGPLLASLETNAPLATDAYHLLVLLGRLDQLCPSVGEEQAVCGDRQRREVATALERSVAFPSLEELLADLEQELEDDTDAWGRLHHLLIDVDDLVGVREVLGDTEAAKEASVQAAALCALTPERLAPLAAWAWSRLALFGRPSEGQRMWRAVAEAPGRAALGAADPSVDDPSTAIDLGFERTWRRLKTEQRVVHPIRHGEVLGRLEKMAAAGGMPDQTDETGTYIEAGRVRIPVMFDRERPVRRVVLEVGPSGHSADACDFWEDEPGKLVVDIGSVDEVRRMAPRAARSVGNEGEALRIVVEYAD